MKRRKRQMHIHKTIYFSFLLKNDYNTCENPGIDRKRYDDGQVMRVITILVNKTPKI